MNLRDSEFVAILGPSGSGKTTLLNVIGGLDRYDSGDMVINGVSTKEYRDRDWDAYRNHAIGFVFQNYNLIPHQSILANVELALTISGISKDERRKRAKEALEDVGLGDQSHKRPNQISGGQMQRVAIARALVNNPHILLADEPTGALDSETSIQVMDLLKAVAKDRLVIMVTHNAQLADKYANRIVQLHDGAIIGDSNPLTEATTEATPPASRAPGKARMSFTTALSLSLNNLLTKKTRTFLTSFAGSIGIIGIALILSLSGGMQGYIKSMQEDTLSTYPLQITSQSVDLGGMISSMMGSNKADRTGRDPERVYSNNIMNDMVKSLTAQINKNDLRHFKAYLESDEGQSIVALTTTIQYSYNLDLQIYSADTSRGILRVNPSDTLAQLTGMGQGHPGTGIQVNFGNSRGSNAADIMSTNTWSELIGNDQLLQKQYDLLAGSWPVSFDEIVLVVDENNELSDAVLYSLGILDPDQLATILEESQAGKEIAPTQIASFSYEDLLGLSFKLVPNTHVYEKENGIWVAKGDKETFMKPLINEALPLKVVGILRPNPEISAASISGSVAYTGALTEYVAGLINDSPIVKEQQADPETNVLTGLPFAIKEYTENLTITQVNAYVQTLPPEQQAQFNRMTQNMSEAEILTMFGEIMRDNAGSPASFEDNLTLFGVVDLNDPKAVNIHPKDFQAKDSIEDLIEEYNNAQKTAGNEEYVINYTDMVAVLMSSVTSIINIITYVLIAFVAISLVVSSIMIAIITYISVLERTKEIGILRSIGASKSDISRVFNAETVIEGLVAGGLGVGIAILLNIPINLLIKSLAGISGIATLPPTSALALILLSVALTVIAGLVPARIAAKKDPVEALRTE